MWTRVARRGIGREKDSRRIAALSCFLWSRNHHVAIIGTGPSGFYTAKYILDQHPEARVDMYDKLPTPFGLVRYGVAPDHPEVKSVTSQFGDIAKHERFRYFGNIEVGDSKEPHGGSEKKKKVVSLNSLRQVYPAVVLAYGAASDLALGLPDEEKIANVWSAREFVNWYNGYPDYIPKDSAPGGDDMFSLRKVKNVVIVGQGNVALDCARILADSCDVLAKTDISSKALAVLRDSAVETITLVGRRGHVQAAFTIKEFRELTKLESNVKVQFEETELKLSMTESSKKELEGNRPRKRIVDLVEKTAASSAAVTSFPSKSIKFRFLTNPVSLISDESTTTGTDSRRIVSGIEVSRMVLQGEPHAQRAVPAAVADGNSSNTNTNTNSSNPIRTEVLPCQLVLKSIGYKCEPISADIPFNTKSHTIPSHDGRVVDITSEDRKVVSGLYVTGWLKRGPVGIIGTNISDARETAAAVVADISSNIHISSSSSSSTDPISALPEDESVILRTEAINWQQYMNVDTEEVRRGERAQPFPKIREKILYTEEMLQIARSSSSTEF